MTRPKWLTVLGGIAITVATFGIALVATDAASGNGTTTSAVAPAGEALQLPVPVTTGDGTTPTSSPTGGGGGGTGGGSGGGGSGSGGGGGAPVADAAAVTGSEVAPDSPTLTPPDGSLVTEPPAPIVEILDDTVRFFDPCAEGTPPSDCPDGAVQSTILAYTMVGPFQILGATFAPIPGVDAAYDLCNSYYTQDRPDAATLAIYSNMPGAFSIRVSATRRVDAPNPDETTSTAQITAFLPRASVSTAEPQTTVWTREIRLDHPNPGVVTCRQIAGIQAGDALVIHITGNPLPALREPYTNSGSDTFDLSTAFAGAHRRQPSMIVTPTSPVTLDVMIPLRHGGQATAAVIPESLPGGCGGQAPDVVPGATVMLQRSDFHNVALPAGAQALLRESPFFWDAQYDTVVVGKIRLPESFRSGAVCGFMFDNRDRLVDRQEAKITAPASGLAVHVDVHLRGDGQPRSVCGTCTTIDFVPQGARGASCVFRGVGTQSDYRDVCGAGGFSPALGATYLARVRVQNSSGPGLAFSWDGVFDTERLDQESSRCSSNRATCRDHSSPSMGIGDLYDPNVSFVFHMRYNEIAPRAWSINPVTHPPGANLELVADPQAHLQLVNTSARVARDDPHSIVIAWVADRPVRVSARIESPQTLTNYAACDEFPVPLSPVNSSGFATAGFLRISHLCANNFGVVDRTTGRAPGILYQIALQLTTANGVVSSYGSSAPLGRGNIGAGLSVRLPFPR